ATRRSEEHTSELQSRLVISYAVFCLKKKTIEQAKAGAHSSKKEAEAVAAADAEQLHFFLNDTQTTKIYTTRHTLSLHDALPISATRRRARGRCDRRSSCEVPLGQAQELD